jgi:peptidoglycan pentaglycine glycine transferase (the first glycine)
MDSETWNALISTLPAPHLLQSYEWGMVKQQYGWHPLFQTWKGPEGRPQAAALVLLRALPVAGFSSRLRVLYVPKGPLLDWSNAGLRRQVLKDLAALARRQGAIFVKIDPDVVTGSGPADETSPQVDPAAEQVLADLHSLGWQYSQEQIQFRNTVLVDLAPDPDELLNRMKQKTRYNIRLAERKGVKIRPGSRDDLPLLYRMYAETAVRDGFVIREEGYYRSVWETFMQAGKAQPLIAEVEGEPVAGVVLFYLEKRAWYMHGMSRPQHREKMPNYLLQWEAMLRAKAAGCLSYDLWGAPEVFAESDPMWGVYRFKEGLGGTVVRTVGAYDFPVRPTLYTLYTRTLPRILDWMRARSKTHTRRVVSG